MRKVSIIGGAGTLGAAIAYEIARNEIIDEICLIDINENLLLNHIMDLKNAFPRKIIYSGTYENLKDTNVVVITAGIPNRNDIVSRNEFLEGNIKLIREFGKHIYTHAPNALIITASNPVDILNYFLFSEYPFEKRQLLGYTHNDSLRFEWALREVLKLKSSDVVFSPVIGEHGSSQVPLFSKVRVNGAIIPISDVQEELVRKKLTSWFTDFNNLNINRTTGWTTALGMGKIIRKILEEKPISIIGSTVLEGEYGADNLSLGVPLCINNKGIINVEEWELSESEQKNFNQSVMGVTKIIDKVLLEK